MCSFALLLTSLVFFTLTSGLKSKPKPASRKWCHLIVNPRCLCILRKLKHTDKYILRVPHICWGHTFWCLTLLIISVFVIFRMHCTPGTAHLPLLTVCFDKTQGRTFLPVSGTPGGEKQAHLLSLPINFSNQLFGNPIEVWLNYVSWVKTFNKGKHDFLSEWQKGNSLCQDHRCLLNGWAVSPTNMEFVSKNADTHACEFCHYVLNVQMQSPTFS